MLFIYYFIKKQVNNVLFRIISDFSIEPEHCIKDNSTVMHIKMKV